MISHFEAVMTAVPAQGVEVTLELWEHMWHTWHYHDLPEADQALAEAAAFLAAQLIPWARRSGH